MKPNGSAKLRLNLSIDIMMFVLLLAMAGIGFLMKYVVVRGEIRNVQYGNDVDLEFLNLNRHQWGSVHLTISIIFMVLIVLHIILHWKSIVSFFKCQFPSLLIRYIITGCIVIIGLLFLVSPFFVEPQKVAFEPKQRNRSSIITSEDLQVNREISDIESHHYMEYSELEIYGYHTLQNVSDRYNIPVAVMVENLNIPESFSGERLSLLRKRYNITMGDVRQCILDYREGK